MKLAVCSDIHDNIWKLEAALPLMSQAQELVFCGDFCSPFSLAQLADGFKNPIHVVLGNNDGDVRLLMEIAKRAKHVTMHGLFADLWRGGLHIAVNHYPDIAKHLAQSSGFDIVLYGHDHLIHEELIGDTLLLNPGEIMGRFGKSTFMILDTSTRIVTVTEIP
jgi:putative phosphoesterase